MGVFNRVIRDSDLRNTAAVAAAALAVILLLVFAWLTPRTVFYGLDQAISLGVGRLMTLGELPLLGPPSHMGGRHLGPLFYYQIFIAMAVARGDEFLATIYLNLLSIAGLGFLLAVLWQLVDRRYLAAAVAGASLVLFSEPYIWILRDPWQPNYLFACSSFVLLAAILVSRSGLRYLPLYVLAASISLQIHFSSIPFVGAAGGTAAAIYIVRKRSLNIPKFGGVLCLAASVLMWIPSAIYEQLYPSNILAMFNTHGEAAAGRVGLYAGLRETSLFLASRTFSGWLFGCGTWKLLCAALSAVCAALLGCSLWRSSEQEKQDAAWILAAVCAVYVFALSRLSPPLYGYYASALLPLPPIIAGLCSASAWRILRQRTPFVMRAAAIIYSASLLGAGLIGLYASYKTFSGTPVARWNSLWHAREVARLIEDDAREPHGMLFKAASTISGDGILLEMNPPRYAETSYAKYYAELPSFGAGTPQYDKSYLLFCPVPNKEWRKKMWTGLDAEWEREREVDITKCEACRNCRMYYLRRKTGEPPASQ